MASPCFYLAVALLFGSTRALSIYPTRATVRTHGMIAVACVSHTPPMEDCEFRIRYHDPEQPTKFETPVFEFRPLDGFTTKRVMDKTGHKYFDVKASGLPAEPHACAIVLKDVYDGRYLIGCRAKDEEGGPVERYMALRVDEMSDEGKSAYEDRNMIQTVTFGNESAAIELKSERGGKFNGPCELQGPQKVTQTGPSRLNAGETVCTLPIRADDTARGVVWAAAPFASPKNGNKTELFMKIVTVVGSPKNTTLALSPSQPDGTPAGETQSYQEGGVLTATCTAHGADHGADFEWTWGDEPLAFDVGGWTVSNRTNRDEWTWPWEEKTVRQTISRRFDARDNGTALKCTARFLNEIGEVEEIKDSDTKVVVQSDVELCLIGNSYERCESEIASGIGSADRNGACSVTSRDRFLYLWCICFVLYASMKK